MVYLNEAFVLCLIAVAANADDRYCSPAICPPGTHHIACGRDLVWSPQCPEDAELVEITPELQQIFLDSHNRLRNQQAFGQTPGFAPAKRMATMTWSEELADLAKYNTMKCRFGHDQCQSTRMFYLAGQNLALTDASENEYIAQIRPETWFSEYVNADMAEIRSHSSLAGANGKSTGHFTQIVKDDAYKVGCSITKFTENGSQKSLVACNYSVSNIRNWPIYEEGETASACQTGTNPQYPGLCSVSEVYEKPYFRPNF